MRDWTWDPLAWKLPIPPRVAESMDDAHKWAVACTRAALIDYGWPDRPFDGERTAVVLGNAMSGERHYLTALRIAYPELAHELDQAPTFQALTADVRKAISAEFGELIGERYPEITEDTMPGELGNCMAGRVANLFDLHGPNYVVDAACASALAAIDSSVAGLVDRDYDIAIAGGVDRNMGASSYVKFCKIGALSATGTRPFDAGADGFVMGEGAGVFVLKRLADAERDGDRVYAVLRGIGGASDGRGKGITAPNPVGQRLAVERAWRDAGISPASCGMVECHGTSTRVGDVVEVSSIGEVFSGADLAPGSVAIGSAKSNIGHLKAAAGAAGFLKAVLAIHHKELPPSLHVEELNPNIDWSASPFKVNTELRPWDSPADGVRTAGVSAFGFGGTNFHVVVEEHVPGRLTTNGQKFVAVGADLASSEAAPAAAAAAAAAGSVAPVAEAGPKAPPRGALVLGADDEATLVARLQAVQADAVAGQVPKPAPPAEADLRAPERVAIDYADAAELAEKAAQALAAFEQPARWKVLRGRGIFRGSGPAPKVAFLYTGQGSQYANMLATLRDVEDVVSRTFDEADAVMTPLIGRPLTSYLFADPNDPDAVAAAEADLRRTEITQPAVLAVDLALTRLLAAYGIVPDLVMGHSLGEYGALVAAGALTFPAALEAVSAHGREMAELSVEDNGAMAAVFAPLAEIEKIVGDTDGYVVVANVNSNSQAVIGGATAAVEAAVARCLQRDFQTAMLPVSHAFHTSIVAPASEPLRRTLERLDLRAPEIPIVANVTGELYPMGPGVVEEMLDLLATQVAAPVQFVKGLRTLYDEGARVFVEVGPKKALQGFATDVLGDDVVALATNHPKLGDTTAFNQALCGLYAAGVGVGQAKAPSVETLAPAVAATTPIAPTTPASTVAEEALPASAAATVDAHGPAAEPVVITGAALGLPGAPHVFDDANVARILHGEQGIDVIPTRIRHEMVDRHITRLVKGESGARFETIDSPAEVIKLAGRAGEFDLGKEFGVDIERIPALGRETQLAMAAGIDALRDAGIPLVRHYRTTTVGSQLPDGWTLPEDMRDSTGVIFASAFPGYNDFADEVARYGIDAGRREQLTTLEAVRAKIAAIDGDGTALAEIDRRIDDLERTLEHESYAFDRRFLFRVLSMGHSQFAELIGARGPNTQVNTACASTTQAIALAEDWIRAGRCQRVIVIAADDVTSDVLLGWMGSGFLASGAAATDAEVEEAAVPFDRRRHGMILGMGAAAVVVETPGSARERGIRPICELLGAVTANSAFHGTRLDVDHIGNVMESVVAQAEARGASREEMAPAMVFISHETYTPARGGSAAAEVNALRRVFGDAADQVVVANTKGFTGHPMGVGIEDVVAVKALETGIVPPVPNFKEPDPDLGALNLSIGGVYPVRYALRLAAGFGSQISMVVLRWVPTADGQRPSLDALGYTGRVADPDVWESWLAGVSGDTEPHVEVDHRTLRVVARDSMTTTAPATKPEPAAPAAPAAPAEPAAPVAPVTPAAVPEAPTPVPPAPVPSPAPAAEAAVAAAPAVAAPAAVGEDLVARVVALVAEQTGYPPELLDLDLDLEADLGIDTVKQAELFAQVRETYGIERDDTLKLRDYPTLNHVIGFVRDRAPSASQAPVATPPVAEPAKAEPAAVAAPAAGEDLVARVVALVAEQTGYPPELLDLDLDLEADLGIDTVKQAELFAQVRETYGIERDDTLKLRDYPTLNHVIGFVRDRAPSLPGTPEPTTQPPTPATTPTVAEPAKVEPAAVAAPAAGEDLVARVVALVAEQTGYPPELLDLDLDLEADLGIDTVKQAELFAQVRETYGIERDDALKLRDYPTLNHVIGFVRDRTPQPATQPPPTADATTVAEPAAVASPPAAGEDLVAQVVALVAEQTGYPPELLDLDLDLEADLGIDTVKQAELFAQVRETYGIERDDALKLRDYPTLNHVIGFVRHRMPSAPQPTPEPTTEAPTQAAAAPAAEPAAVAAPAPAGEDVAAQVVALVAEQTGYPPELLDLDLDLEADLGIDTVKQAELFAQVRETYGIERDDTLKLRDYPTLNHVIGFVRDRTPQPATQALPTADETMTTSPSPAPAEEPVDDAGFPRRVPAPVVRPPLDVFAPTGVRLEAGSRVVILPDQGGVAEALSAALGDRGVEVLRLDVAGETEAAAAQLEAWQAAGRIDGIYALAALDTEAPIAELDLEQWHNGLHARVKVLAAAARAFYDALGEAGSFVVAATRNGGAHGYDDSGARSAMAGAVCGFTKALARERPAATVKVVDVATTAEPGEVAGALVDETLGDAGVVEVGRRGTLRVAIGMEERPAPPADPARVLGPGSVVVATGAAGSIVSAIVADLARAAGGGTFHLLDLIPEPDLGDPDLARFTSDRDGLKRELATRIAERGERATPVLIERDLAAIERRCAAKATIDAVVGAGGTVRWYAADLRDAQAMGEAAAAIRATSERVDVLLHAGGLEISRLLPDKSPAEFDLVFDVKADGWFHLLHGLGDTPIGAGVVFSSIAGRFGNGGQTDYSAANDLLCKSVSSFRTTRPGTRGVAIDWTAWADIGMATRGSIPKVMAAAGIDMLPSAIGIPVVRREVTAGGDGGEIVVAGALGVMLEPRGPAIAAAAPTDAGPMVGQVETDGDDVVVVTELDPAAQPFLDHHRIEGTPVLPGVMGMEAFAEAARLLAPGWQVTALEDVEFLAPFKWYRDEPRRLEVHVRAVPVGDQLVAECRLDGRRTLPGQPERVTTHFTGRVVLSPRTSDLGKAAPPPDPAGRVVGADDIYRIFFHGPAYQVLTGVWRDGDRTVGELAGGLPAGHAGGMLVAAPRLVEACFQTAGIAGMATDGGLGLPRRLRRVELAACAAEGPGLRAVTTAGGAGGVDAVVIDGDGRVLVRLSGYETVALPGAAGADLLAPLEAALR